MECSRRPTADSAAADGRRCFPASVRQHPHSGRCPLDRPIFAAVEYRQKGDR